MDASDVVRLDRAPRSHVIEAGRRPGPADFAVLEIVRCTSCGHMWNAGAEAVLGHHAEFLTNAPVSEEMASRHRHLVGELTAGRAGALRVLDVGAGSGALSAAFASAGHVVTAVEPSRALEPSTGMRFGFRVLNHPWPVAGIAGETFDLVVCVQVLEHTHDPVVVLASILRVLAPGGRAYVEVPSGAWVSAHASPIDIHAPHTHYFSGSSFRLVARRAGSHVGAVREILHGRDVGYTLVGGDGTADLPQPGSAGDLGAAVGQLRERVASLSDHRVAIYGANAGTQALLGWVPAGPWDVVLDDTPAYWGHSVYSSDSVIPIADPRAIDMSVYTHVLIASYVHDSAIARRLRERGFSGEILSLRPPTAVTDGPPSLLGV